MSAIVEVAEKKSTHKVEVVPIVLEKHPNADSLSIVRVYGYQCVVKTADWTGVDTASYVQPDSMVPNTPEYAFLRACSTCTGTGNAWTADRERVDCPDCQGKGTLPLRDYDRRIRVRKFRGQMSQGMLVKAPAGSKVGDDVSDILGITRYEPPEPGMHGAKNGPVNQRKAPSCYVPVYDVENWYRYGKATFTDGEPIQITEKLHGSNFRAVYSSADKDFFVGSRRHWLREYTEVPARTWYRRLSNWLGITKPRTVEYKNIWFDAARKHPWIEDWCRHNPDTVLFGEVYGKQDLKYGVKDGDIGLAIFDMYGCSSGIYAMPIFHSVPCVPILYEGPYSEQVVRSYIDGKSQVLGANHMREGIVIRSSRTGNKLKAVSDAYLERAK